MTLSGARHQSLLAPAPAVPELPGPLVVQRHVQLQPVGDEQLDVRAVWRVELLQPGVFKAVLAGASLVVDRLVVDGELLAATRNDAGELVLEVALARSCDIELRGHVRGDPGSGVALGLLTAGTGRMEHPSDFAVQGQGAVLIAPGLSLGAPAQLQVAPAPVRNESQGTLVFGETALGITVGEAEVRVRGRLRWRIARGELARVSFSVPGAGEDLEVTGAVLASWERAGDTIEATLRQPERSLVELQVSYTVAAGGGETSQLAVPVLRPDGVFRTTSTLQLARDGQLDLIPELGNAVVAAPDDLPAWGRDLVEGAPTGSFVGLADGGKLTVYRFTPADSPATIVDVASYTMSATDEGRVLLRAHYAVRNDRGAVLRVRPPPGLRPIGARVGGEVATVAREGETWLVPLEKSVETVEGLLSFPVEVLFLGELPGGWAERGSVPLPSVDAEVAVARATLHLPPGWKSKTRPGDHGVVDAFTEGQGITYGFAVGDVRAGQADMLFQQAVDAWMGNDFDQTGAILDELEGMGASNADIGRLRSNLSVVSGKKADTGGNEQLERRVLEQARARASEDEEAQKEELKKAEEAYNAGDYKAAEEAYRNALEVGEDLAKLQVAEDARQDKLNSMVKDRLVASQQVQKQKVASSTSQSNLSYDNDDGDVVTGATKKPPVVIVDRDIEITGLPEDRPNGAEEAERLALEDAEKARRSGDLASEKRLLEETERMAQLEAEAKLVQEQGTFEQTYDSPSEEPVLMEPAPMEPARSQRGLRFPNLGGAEPPEVAAGPTVTEVLPTPYSDPNQVAQVLRETLGVSGLAAGEHGVTITGSPEMIDQAHQMMRQLDISIDGASVEPEGERFEVTAAALSVVIPTQGERVLYQQLLLPPGAPWELQVRAKEPRRNR